MADFFEVDFLEVHSTKSGDALTIRYEVGGSRYIHVVDGGYLVTGELLVTHINEYYDAPNFINHVVVTHPDKDHAEGIQKVLEAFEVGALWVLLPWNYVDELIDRFDRYTNLENLKRKLREAYPYLVKLEELAKAKAVPIRPPFQGAQIGAFKVLSPTKKRYLDLVVTSAKTPAQSVDDRSLMAKAEAFIIEATRQAKNFVQALWGQEVFPNDGTSNENEMSVIQLGQLCGEAIVLTADAGREGLAEAAAYAPSAGLVLPGGVNRFQIPHHGGRHNVSTEILNTWFGPPATQPVQTGAETFTAVVSAAENDEDHPRKVVVRGFKHRGARVISTGDGRGTKSINKNAPRRLNWEPAIYLDYPAEMES